MAARGAFLLPRAGSDRFAAEGEAAWRLLAWDRLLRLEVPDRSRHAHALRLHERDGGDQAGQGPPIQPHRVGVGGWARLLAARHAVNPPGGAWRDGGGRLPR